MHIPHLRWDACILPALDREECVPDLHVHPGCLQDKEEFRHKDREFPWRDKNKWRGSKKKLLQEEMHSWCCAKVCEHSLPCESCLRAVTFANSASPWVIWLRRVYCEKICCLATALTWCNWLFCTSKKMFYSLVAFLRLLVWIHTHPFCIECHFWLWTSPFASRLNVPLFTIYTYPHSYNKKETKWLRGSFPVMWGTSSHRWERH